MNCLFSGLRVPATIAGAVCCLALASAPATFAETAEAAAPAKPPGKPAQKPAAPGVEEVRKFLADAEAKLFDLTVEAGRAQWVQSNFITYDTETLAAQRNEVL